ncbi:MAG: glycoside hydrolase family 1 protein [Myxococcaceae bacterium]
MSARGPLGLALLLVAGCTARPPSFSEQFDAETVGRTLPSNFLLGTATASHQVEGGNSNDWTDWEASSYPDGRPHIRNNDQSGLATDSWNRFDEDLQLMKSLGSNAYRFSIEWSRVEPEKGVFDDAALDRYRDWARKLRQNGITPMVTLWHFALPKWVAAQGGFEVDETKDDFRVYVAHVAERLGADVDFWCTLNEPNVYITFSYLLGQWPPGKVDQALSGDVLARLMEAHAVAAQALRENDVTDADGDGFATRIGIAQHMRIFQPATQATLDIAIAGLTDEYFNSSFIDAVATGHIRLNIPGAVDIDRDVEGLKGSFDYLGINYYTRDHVRADLTDPALSHQYVPSSRPMNDLGWDIYPEGLYVLVKRFSRYGWPIYITENGIADAAGDKRPQYLLQHLAALERAHSEGVDVRGYFHWALLDNFEWADGFTPRFGLYSVNYADPTLPRNVTPAVETFKTVAGNLGAEP